MYNLAGGLRHLHRPTYLRCMTFVQRLLRYLIGVLIGCFIVFLLFPNRDWLSWTPSRVLMRQVNYFPMQLHPNIRCLVRCDRTLAARILHARAAGKPDFNRSLTRAVPRIYRIADGPTELTVSIENDSLITLLDVNPPPACPCP